MSNESIVRRLVILKCSYSVGMVLDNLQSVESLIDVSPLKSAKIFEMTTIMTHSRHSDRTRNSCGLKFQ